MDSVHFDSIWVIESLRPGDMRTGAELTTLLNPLSEVVGGLTVELLQPGTRQEFLDALSRVERETRAGRHSPIIHVETHGNEHGLTVASDESITWQDLKAPLTAINMASGLNLLVVAAACKGLNLIRVVHPTDRAPVWGVVGPSTVVGPTDLARSFRAFYDELLTSFDGRRALERLNGAPTVGAWRYHMLSARFMFRQVFHGYIVEQMSASAVRERASTLARQVRRRQRLSKAETKRLRGRLRSNLRDKRHFRRLRRHFFMIDLFPQNRGRFPLTFRDCERDAADDPG